MADSDLIHTSKFISLILRHHPEVIGITVDEHGWADVQQMIEGINNTGKYHLNQERLEQIVRHDSKQRYALNEDHTRIRANQGHSIPVDVNLKEQRPPEILYHGTGEKSVQSIEKNGLLPMTRLYVHLSKDARTARQVGSRHGRPVVFAVASGWMAQDGFVFYCSVNGIWLTKQVPPKYLARL